MEKVKVDKIIRSRRRTLSLAITQDAQLIVRAPFGISDKLIKDFVSQKKEWIEKKQEIAKKRKAQTKTKQFINGEEFFYLGSPYRFRALDRRDIVLTEYLEFPKSLLPQARSCLIEWYRAKALNKISERLDFFVEVTGLRYKSLRISNAYKRFGSCSASGRLNFAWRLIIAPLQVIDYVIVHELAHLEVRNHSRRFWSKVKTIIPDYKKYQRWLKENGHLLVV
ncbi:MAG: M48 family metallopeptidase [Candidatus Omnitrophica bacterium]|nr:M48 family metallopeptidase [Candidatus Omnitrophota bacterium]